MNKGTHWNGAIPLLLARGWFSQLDPLFQRQLMENAQLVLYEKGQNIYNIGMSGAGPFGVACGSVNMLVPREDGMLVPIFKFGPGHWLSDLAVLPGQFGQISLEANENTSVIKIPPGSVRKMMCDNPKFHQCVYKLFQLNITLALRIIAGLTVGSAKAKIVLRLLLLDECATRRSEWIEYSHLEFSEQLGLSIPTVQRTLKMLSEKKVVELGYRRVRITDRTRMSSTLTCV